MNMTDDIRDDFDDYPTENSQQEIPGTEEFISSKEDLSSAPSDEKRHSPALAVFSIFLLLCVITSGFFGLKWIKYHDFKNDITKPIITQNTNHEPGIVKKPETVNPVEKKPEPNQPPVVEKNEVIAPPVMEKPEETKPSAEEVVPNPSAEEAPNGSTTVMPMNKNADTVVSEFYNWYSNYEGKAIKNIKDSGNGYLENSLIDSLLSDYNEKNDPFLCGASKPIKIEVDLPSSATGKTTVPVNLIGSNGVVTSALVTLKLEDLWKISKVMCLSPDAKRSVLENLKQKTGLDYVSIKSMDFFWNLPDYKGRKALNISGKGFSTENTSVDPSVLENFFFKNGFTTNRYNENGYEKKGVFCVAKAIEESQGHYSISTVCGQY